MFGDEKSVLNGGGGARGVHGAEEGRRLVVAREQEISIAYTRQVTVTSHRGVRHVP